MKVNFSAALSLSHHVVRAAVETHGFTCYDVGDSDSDWADSDGEANRIVSVASAARAAAERAGKRPPTHRTPTKAKRTVARTPDSPIEAAALPPKTTKPREVVRGACPQ